MYVAEGVLAAGLEHRPAQDSLGREAAALGDVAGRVVTEGVAEFEAVQAEVGQRPAGGQGEGADGDVPAAGLGRVQ